MKEDAGLEREVTELLERARMIDTAGCDRHYRHPGEKPLHYDPAAIVPLVGGGVLGIGHLCEEIAIRDFDRTKVEPPGEITHISVLTPAGDVVQILREFDSLRRHVEAHPDKAAIVGTAEEMERVSAAGRLALVLGLDSGNETGGDPLVLGQLFRAGLRKMAMTHEAATPFSGSNSSEPKTTPGLNPLGREMVAECNRLGIMIDVSHCSDLCFWGLLQCTKAPVLATHSGARGARPAGLDRRNLSDEMLRALAENGGMVGIGGSTDLETYLKVRRAGYYECLTRISHWMLAKYPDREELAAALRNPAKQAECRRALGLPKELPGSEYVDHLNNAASTLVHLDYVGRKIGWDRVGIGTDTEMYSPFYRPMIRGIAAGLLQRKFSEERIRAILRGNFLRYFRDVERAAA